MKRSLYVAALALIFPLAGGAVSVAGTLDEYLMPDLPPAFFPARFAYFRFGYADPMPLTGRGEMRLEILPSDSRLHAVMDTETDGEAKKYFGISSAQQSSFFISYTNDHGIASRGIESYRYDCFFPKILLRGVAKVPSSVVASLEVDFACLFIPGTVPASPRPAYTARYEAPAVVTVEDGNSIEVVKVQVLRDGQPWGDYQFGYRLGPMRFDAAETTKNFFSVPQLAVTSLPPPAVEGTVVEYRNTQDFPQSPGGHFFYSSDPVEQASVDAGQAGKFERTGHSFNAGGYLPVCRFYGSVSPGPNSHFFSALPEECALLKSLQRTYIAPSTEPQWNSEGNGFYTVAPLTDAQGQKTCLAGTQAVYRAYNNAFPVSGSRNPWDSNHRFSTQRADIDELVQRYGWRDEGIVFCAPLSASPASR